MSKPDFYLPDSSTATSVDSPSPSSLRVQQPSYPFPSVSEERSESDDDDLPYPTPLPRSAFLEPDFDPPTYLASLRNRHQTLEDLRTELRDRVRALNAELVDVVNSEYEALMSVGLGLRGGDEKVAGVRVGVLGFRREINGLRDAVAMRRDEVGSAITERKRVRDDMVLGRRLLDIDERLAEVEIRLGVVEGEADDEEEDRLNTTAALYAQLLELIDSVGEHPFVEGQRHRVKAVREALLSDLAVTLRAAKFRRGDPTPLLAVMAQYREIGEAAEAVKALKAG